jgi:hypothetical protein
MAPLLWIEARDRLFSRRGNMLVKLLSSFPIADAKGPEIDQGSALRWLAEAVWFPLGFAGGAVRWEPIGERSARAAIDCGELSGSLVFEIDEEGKFAWMRGNRYRDLGNGKLELTAWVGRCLEYREFDVFRAPSSVEVSWQLEDGLFTYARFQVTGIEYNVARQF